MSKRQAKLVGVVILIGAFVFRIGAQESGLYGPESSGTDAFVRVLNATSTAELASLDLGTYEYESVGLVTPYRRVPSGIFIASAGSHSAEVVAPRSAYVTVAVTDAAISVIRDARHDDPARAQLVLYAVAAGAPVSLVTGNGEVTVIDGVSPGRSQAIAVNAVPVNLAVVSDEQILGTTERINLRRGQSYSVFVLPEGRSPRVRWARAEVSTE